MVFCKGGGKCKHFDKESAEKAVSRIYYTTKDGAEDEDAPCNKIWRYMESFE